MSVATKLAQEDIFQNVINPSFISNTDYANEAGNTYNMFSGAGFEAMNQPTNPFLLPSEFDSMGASAGFASNAGNIFFDSTFQMPAHQDNGGSQTPFPNSYFLPMTEDSDVGIMKLDDEPIASHQEIQRPPTASTTHMTRKQTHPVKQEPAVNAVPECRTPVKKRRNRKTKKQPTEEEARIKRERFLERNRIAASKCRTKKKQSTNELEEKLREFQSERKIMENDIHLLMSELDLYKEELQKHAHCGNRAIEIWLTARADAIANNLSSTSSLRAASSYLALQSSPTSPTYGGSLHPRRRGSVEYRQETVISQGSNTMSRDSPHQQWPEQIQGSMNRAESTYSGGTFDSTEGGSRESSVESAACTDMDYHSTQRDSGISDIGSPHRSFDRKPSLSSSSDCAFMNESEQLLPSRSQRLFVQTDYQSFS